MEYQALIFYQKSNQQGFTLLEVVVAVAVFAIAASMLLVAGGGAIKKTAYLEEKTLANLIAENYLVELKLENEWPAVGEKTEEVVLAGRKWEVKHNVSQAGDEKRMRKVVVSVERKLDYHDGEPHLLAELQGYLVKLK